MGYDRAIQHKHENMANDKVGLLEQLAGISVRIEYNYTLD